MTAPNNKKQLKSEIITVRVSKKLKKDIENRVDELGLGLAPYISMLINKDLKKRK